MDAAPTGDFLNFFGREREAPGQINEAAGACLNSGDLIDNLENFR